MTTGNASPAPEGADDLEVLHPERTFLLAGITVTMREYGFVEGMKLANRAQPVVHDLAAITGVAEDGGLLEYARLQAVFADHVDVILDMVAQACDQPRAWVESLDPADGEKLLLAWWAVNGPFFVRRVLMETQLKLVNRLSAGAPSTPRSPPLDTVPPSSLAAAPAVN